MANEKMHLLPPAPETAYACQTPRNHRTPHPHRPLYKDTIHLYKFKAHAGILGNECADAITKCSAENQSGHDIHSYTDARSHLLSSIFWPERVENPPPACLPDTLNTCQPGPPPERLSIFSDLDAAKAHMHVQLKLCLNQKRFQTISTQITKNRPRKAVIEKERRN